MQIGVYLLSTDVIAAISLEPSKDKISRAQIMDRNEVTGLMVIGSRCNVYPIQIDTLVASDKRPPRHPSADKVRRGLAKGESLRPVT